MSAEGFILGLVFGGMALAAICGSAWAFLTYGWPGLLQALAGLGALSYLFGLMLVSGLPDKEDRP